MGDTGDAGGAGDEGRRPATGTGTVPESMTAMAAVRYGGPEALQPVTLPVPVPPPGCVLVRVAATSVNPADVYLRRGRGRLVFRTSLPFVPGLDVAGTVAAVGPPSSAQPPSPPWQVGDRVWAALPKSAGAYAGYVVVAAGVLARAPRSLTLADAAALPLVGLTALQGLRDEAGLDVLPGGGGAGAGTGGSAHGGRRVLVVGGAGGVGAAAVQLAADAGAHVTATASARDLDLVRGLGAAQVLDRRGAGSPQTLARRPREVAADTALDAAGRLGPLALRRLVGDGGVAVTVNPLPGNPLVQAATRRLPGARVRFIGARPDGPDLERLRERVDAGGLRPLVGHRLPLSEAGQAHRLQEAGGLGGKIVLVVDEELATLGTPAE